MGFDKGMRDLAKAQRQKDSALGDQFATAIKDGSWKPTDSAGQEFLNQWNSSGMNEKYGQGKGAKGFGRAQVGRMASGLGFNPGMKPPDGAVQKPVEILPTTQTPGINPNAGITEQPMMTNPRFQRKPPVRMGPPKMLQSQVMPRTATTQVM